MSQAEKEAFLEKFNPRHTTQEQAELLEEQLQPYMIPNHGLVPSPPSAPPTPEEQRAYNRMGAFAGLIGNAFEGVTGFGLLAAPEPTVTQPAELAYSSALPIVAWQIFGRYTQVD
jgi:hypothetical protein